MSSENEKPENDQPEGDTNQDEAFLHEKATDEDWKAKAQQEKEKLASKKDAPPPELPPASFLGLLEELSLRTLFALGQLPNPATGEVVVDLPGAKYAIDMLGVLEEKTKRNLDETEEAYLKDLVQKLRMGFVQVSRDPEGPIRRAEAARSAAESGNLSPQEGEDDSEPKIII